MQHTAGILVDQKASDAPLELTTGGLSLGALRATWSCTAGKDSQIDLDVGEDYPAVSGGSYELGKQAL